MHVASTCKEASHVIVQSDLVTGNRIPGDRHDDSDTSGNMQRRNSTEVLEGSRLPELGRSAYQPNADACVLPSATVPHTKANRASNMARISVAAFSRARSLCLPSMDSLPLGPRAQPLMSCSVNWFIAS